MRSRTTARFRALYKRLPPEVRARAKDAYRRFARDARHPGLRFKRVHAKLPVWSVRITRHYRALGLREEDEVIWFWIGSHGEYEAQLRDL